MPNTNSLKIIEIYQTRDIISSDCCLQMAHELANKIESDKIILENNHNEDNVCAYNTNQYLYYWLMFDYYNIRSLSSNVDQNDVDNGWFIWLKDFNLQSNKTFKSIDEEYVYFYEKHFDHFFKSIFQKNDYIDEAIWCFENAKYHACACLLFTSIENVERSISAFDLKQKFVMSKEIKNQQSINVQSFNQEYFNDFEKIMNEFLSNIYYANSTAEDPELKVINRNRIMHGIFTRKVDKVDCLKLFVLLDSMIRFNHWLECYRQMVRLSEILSNSNHGD